MARYFFDVFNSVATIDPTGEELSDRQAAVSYAATLFGELIRDLDGSIETEKNIRVTVLDESRKPLVELKIVVTELADRH